MACDQFDLPKEIVQHIQSFLDEKEAARSMILYKPWFTAWSTRPVLYFDEVDLPVLYAFSNFSRKTIQRYKELNLKIDKFSLRKKVVNSSVANLVNELIVDALRLGVNALEVEITNSSPFERYPKYPTYVLPAQVFEARSLMRFYFCWLTINELDGRVLCSCLKSVSLVRCCLMDDIVREILLGCPLIEELDLRDCFGLNNVNVSKTLNLVKFHVSGDIHVDFKDVNGELATHPQTNVPKFCYLRCLCLQRVDVSDGFFMEFLSKFPCIEDLTLEYIDASMDIQFTSQSLRYLNFSYLKGKLKILQCDVPNISRFVFKGVSSLPLLSFITASREWTSEVEFTTSNGVIDASWFLELRNFLTELSLSRISLSIKFNGTCLYSAKEKIPRFTKLVLESLSIFSHPSSNVVHDLLMVLFRICHPNFITKFKSIGCSQDYRIQRLLYELLQNKNKEMLCILLEEVQTEFFEENIMEWLPFAEQTDALAFPQGNKQIRFRLNWRKGI